VIPELDVSLHPVWPRTIGRECARLLRGAECVTHSACPGKCPSQRDDGIEIVWLRRCERTRDRYGFVVSAKRKERFSPGNGVATYTAHNNLRARMYL
jgi:hypothetical protein